MRLTATHRYDAHSHLHYEYEAHPQLCNKGEAQLLLHNWCKAHSYSYFSYHHVAHSHLHYECEHSKLCNELPLWGSLAIMLWMWPHSHLIYHCEAHSNAIGVRLTVTRYATAAKLSHIYIKRVRPTHTWVTTVRLTHSYAHSYATYVRLTHLHYECEAQPHLSYCKSQSQLACGCEAHSQLYN